MLSNCAWMETQNAEQLHGKYQYISFKVQHFREFGIRIKTRGAPELHPLRVMTRDRGGGDDRKLFHSSPSVNYSFPLIRLLPPPPAPAPPLPPRQPPSHQFMSSLRPWVNWSQEMSILMNRLRHCCWHSELTWIRERGQLTHNIMLAMHHRATVCHPACSNLMIFAPDFNSNWCCIAWDISFKPTNQFILMMTNHPVWCQSQ